MKGAEHPYILVYVYVQKCTEMYAYVQKSSGMYINVWKCTKLNKDKKITSSAQLKIGFGKVFVEM